MTNEELNMKLYEKLADSQEKFKGWLLTQPPEEILNHAYEYANRQDIVYAMEYLDLTDEQATALLASPDPLSEIYQEFADMEDSHMDDIRSCIESRGDKNAAAQREALRTLPVYPHSSAYAKEHGKIETYRQSHRVNIDCKNMIEDSIAEHYRDNRLDLVCVQEVIEKYGMERTAFVLANTVQDKSWDGRISAENKEWAKTISVPDDPTPWGGKRTHEFVCSHAHPGLVNLFVTRFRKEQTIEKEKKPSVLKKLHEAKAEQPPKSPGKAKEAEL